EAAARGEPMKSIRKRVKERLVDDLVLGMMELEMMNRSLRRDQPRNNLFPRHHDAKNRAAVLTLNIDDKDYWKKTVVLYTKSLQGWIRGLALRLARFARDNGTALSFGSAMDASLPPAELPDL